jgi:hypothetical protein
MRSIASRSIPHHIQCLRSALIPRRSRFGEDATMRTSRNGLLSTRVFRVKAFVMFSSAASCCSPLWIRFRIRFGLRFRFMYRFRFGFGFREGERERERERLGE